MLSIDARVAELCRLAESVMPARAAQEAAAIRERLAEPLRIALAGRVKAGKSTLLNALVGERLAPTGVGETTRIVSVYHEAMGYQVSAVGRDGVFRDLPFRRQDGVLEIDLGGVAPAEVDRLDIGWPSSALHDLTLIDTPGLASANDANSLRTHEFLTLGDERSNDADGVIYLMMHMHRTDAEFLDAFLDRAVGSPSPVNAVAVLSRADEVGAARLDAMASAARIAARYREDERVRSLCATVVPVAGLLAETALTLREDEAQALRALASLDNVSLEALLLSSDRFIARDAAPLSAEIRRQLLARFGLFGLRLALADIGQRGGASASDLSATMLRASGLIDLKRVIERLFAPRARVLKARSALSSLKQLTRRLHTTDAPTTADLEAGIERLESTALEFAQLRLAHLVLSGEVGTSEAERAEIDRLTSGGSEAARLGVPDDASPALRRETALQAIGRWRSREEDPFSDRVAVEAAQIAVRSYEQIYALMGA